MTSQALSIGTRRVSEVLGESLLDRIIPTHRELIPDLNELYELELAFFESSLLSDDEVVRNGAYFARVGDRLTRHYLMCSGDPVKLPRHSSSRLRSFFSTNQFRTGYASHGLFPYRGKFHPQMIKGLINSMGLKPGDTVLDPMMGSGTVLIEACLMGINSVGYDISPFCHFITKVKLEALALPLRPIRPWVSDPRPIFDYFKLAAGAPIQGSKSRFAPLQDDFFAIKERPDGGTDPALSKKGLDTLLDDQPMRDFLLLAYLDSAGYSERSNRKPPYDQFRAILDRYVFVAQKIQTVLQGIEAELGKADARVADARELPLDNGSVDGIVFSPPYSFAIDYLENDSFHLRSMGVSVDELRKNMIGLRGKSQQEKYGLYRSDMEKVMSECSRVLRSGGICSIVVGTNNNQLSKILGVSPGDVQGIDEFLVEEGERRGLRLVHKLSRKITGIANTMRTEFILMFEKKEGA